MTNPRASILIKPGDESQVYTLGQPRIFHWPADTDVVGNTDFPEPEPTRETEGWDVSDWLAVTALHYCALDDANGEESYITVKPWRYYAASNPIVLANGYTGNLQNVPATGRWIADNDRTPIYIRGTGVTGPMHFSVPTLNCDRIFFQIKIYVPGGEITHFPEYLAQQVYGTTPRSDDGTYPGVIGGETLELETELLLLHADLVAILAQLVDVNLELDDIHDELIDIHAELIDVNTELDNITAELIDINTELDDIHADLGPGNVVYNFSAAAAIAPATATTAEAGPFELIEVTCHLSAAPTTSEQFQVILNANDGAAYDTELFAVDAAQYMGGLTDIVFRPLGRKLYEAGDQINVAWPNTNLRTYGLRIVVKR